MPALPPDPLRDLCWILHSPPLLGAASGLPHTESVKDPDFLQALPALAGSLETLVASIRDPRLGRYFEQLVWFWLEHSTHFSLIAHNVVIYRNGKTLGELDCLVRNETDGSVEHWELAVKFYLGTANGDWVGPNPRDTLARKINRLRDHQLALPRHPEAREWLAARGLEIGRQRVLMRGRLYAPLTRPGLASPTAANPAHERGWWCYHRELDELPDEHWQPLDRLNWLTGEPAGRKNGHALARSELIDYVQTTGRPLQVVQWRPGHAAGLPDLSDVPDHGCSEHDFPDNNIPDNDFPGYRLPEYGFIVPDHWPETR